MMTASNSSGYSGDRLAGMWINSVWKRISRRRLSPSEGPERDTESAPRETLVETPSGALWSLVARSEGRVDPIILVVTRITARTLHFKTPDALSYGERLHLRLSGHGVTLEMTGLVAALQPTGSVSQGWIELEVGAEELERVGRFVKLLGQAA